MNLVNTLTNFQVIKSITYGDTFISNTKSYNTICDGNSTLIYVLHSFNHGKISQFDGKWNHLSNYNVYFPNFILGMSDSSGIKIIMTTQHGIYSFDRNLNLIKFYSNYSANYRRMYYNRSADHLLICCFYYKRIDIFDNSLKFIKSISTPSFPVDIDVYNDLMYVATSSNTILVYQNELYLSQITTLCSSIKASIIDQTGNMAVLCSSDIIYIYSFNGSYLGVNWTSIVPSLVDLSFDTSGNLVLVASNGVFLLNNQTRNTNSSGVSIDSSCIVNSEFINILYLSYFHFIYF